MQKLQAFFKPFFTFFYDFFHFLFPETQQLRTFSKNVLASLPGVSHDCKSLFCAVFKKLDKGQKLHLVCSLFPATRFRKAKKEGRKSCFRASVFGICGIWFHLFHLCYAELDFDALIGEKLFVLADVVGGETGGV
ncbi:hypothetical protein, partial [uncultured Fibrobacter sp.]|uniref:hypothetical protein n=1 Tax=uncultured Fibrobacter sp. TaxID=261512 RepID=UPI00261A9C32